MLRKQISSRRTSRRKSPGPNNRIFGLTVTVTSQKARHAIGRPPRAGSSLFLILCRPIIFMISLADFNSRP
ncbi:hypothetical protein E2C01_050135 [Portunus trituberculatus]|uniref:Uncharacterized protein n=1 Tax=Portunus trituberculatus TaxID=210409 RepID=A0A5B7GB91_PORTR|nr:hypothetical protein [Portunus trituberculatus]